LYQSYVKSLYNGQRKSPKKRKKLPP
jgi:hypothetical protein